jgi:predicted DCC family thiol-disulfide oxidoreductase YuxK
MSEYMPAHQPQEETPENAVQGPETSRSTEITAGADAPDDSAVDAAAGNCARDTLFYDGRCPLCASEIEQLRKTRGPALKLVDIHQMPEGDDTPTKDQLLRVLHLRRADGSWLTSADANVVAWEGTLHGKLLSVLRWPLLRHLADGVYALWALWRYRRLYGRQFKDDTCN